MITNELEEAIKGKDFLVLGGAVPIYKEHSGKDDEPYVKEGQIIVDVAKGIEEDYADDAVSADRAGDSAGGRGGAFMDRAMRKKWEESFQRSCVIGAKTRKTAEYLAVCIYDSKVFRVYTSPDMLGIELGGSLKECHSTCGRNCGWTWLWR